MSNLGNLNFDILRYNSPHFSERNGAKINAIIVHSVGVPLENVIPIFNEYKVSAHYVIPQITAQEVVTLMPDIFGNYTLQYPNAVPVIQLVDDSKKAFHAGASSFADWNSQPECAKGLNPASIGIEFHADGYANGDGSDWYKFVPFTAGQIETGTQWVAYLMETHNIPKQNFLGHGTISVGRKTDPGATFPWQAFADKGLGYLPQPVESTVKVENNDEAIAFVQSRLLAAGFVTCPQTGALDFLTQQNVDAYVMQFATPLWTGQNVTITQGLVDSLNGFNATISAVSEVGVRVEAEGTLLAA